MVNKILVFGDSIVYGKWDTQGGWVARLRQYIDQKYNIGNTANVQVYNLGLNGELCINLAKRLEAELVARIKPNEQTLVIVATGANDTCPNNLSNGQVTSSEQFTQAISAIIAICKKHNCQILLLACPPANESKTKKLIFTTEGITAINSKLEQLANANAVTYLDVYQKLNNPACLAQMQDAIHPGDMGHQAIYDIVLQYLINSEFLN